MICYLSSNKNLENVSAKNNNRCDLGVQKMVTEFLLEEN